MYYWSVVLFMKVFGTGLGGLRSFALFYGLVTVAFGMLSVSTVGFTRRGFHYGRHPSWIAPLRRLAARYRNQIEQQAAEERRRMEREARARG